MLSGLSAGCASRPVSCIPDGALVVPLTFPGRPAENVTNAHLAESMLDLKRDIEIDNARKAELTRQINGCLK